MKTLFLDDSDLRCRPYLSANPWATIARTAAEAIAALGREPFDVVSLDHDLGGQAYVDSSEPETGMEVVRWIVANRPVIPSVIVHSLNEKAAERMVQALKEAGYAVVREPFGLHAQTLTPNR